MSLKRTFSFTNSTIYTLRLYVLLHDIGSPVLRKLIIRRLPVPLEQQLSRKKSYLKTLNERKILFDEQFATLFPDGKAAVSLEDCDISLLIILLRSFCKLKPSNHEIWTNIPSVTDVSPEANITRLRLYRNAILHQPNTDFQLTNAGKSKENNFTIVWDTIKKALLELDACNSPDLESQIDELKNVPINELSADEFKNEAERWMQQNQYNVLGLTELVLASIEEKLFVKTESYKEAQEKLQKNRIVVLKGNPGEGKTTMSRMLAREVGTNKEVMNVSSRSDWRKVKVKESTIIIIDDIFGAGVLDVSEFNRWKKVLLEIETAVKSEESKLHVIVTSRSYILNEALQRMYCSTFLTKENMVVVSSQQLSEKEREQILINHLNNSDRNFSKDFVQRCIQSSNKDSDGNKIFPIGFPESARLFSQEDAIFKEGYEFFQKPMHFIMECMRNVFVSNETIRLAYFLIWAQKNQELHIHDIEKPIEHTPASVITVMQKLQFSPEHYLRKIGHCLEEHKDGLLTFDNRKGLYKFSHRVIADVVGLIAFEKNATAVLSCCDFDFAMRYIRLQKTVSHALYVVPYRYSCLSREVVKFMTIEGGQLDGTIIQHEAFRNNEFCNNFFETLHGQLNSILSVPVQSFSAFFMQSEIELKHEESRLASFSLYKGNGKSVFAKLCFEKSLVPTDVLENELYMSVMIAIKFGSIESLQWLFQHGAKVADEMVILAARENNNDIIEFLRQELDDGKCDVSRGWNRANKPNPIVWLIQNHKIAAVDILAGRHKNFKTLKISNRYSTALHVACYYGETEIAEMIIARYPMLDKENEQGYYPIQIAVKKGHTETVMSLLNKTDNAHKTLTLANKDNIKELTLLHIAIWSDDEILAEKLAETCHFTNKVDAFKRTAMLFALNGGKHRCIKKLLESDKVDKETPDRDGNTPLHIAILKAKHDTSYTQYAKRLSEMVDVNKQNKDGNTPLHLAFAMKQPAIKKELLENPNIKKDIVNKKNKTPSQMLELSNPDSKISDEEDEI